MKSISKSLEDQTELEGGSTETLDDFEELRLLLNSIIRKDVLQELSEIKNLLNKEPKYTEMYSWFVRNGIDGKSCKFSKMALQKFKERRLKKIKVRLEKCLAEIDKLNG